MFTPEELAAIARRFDDIVELEPRDRAAAIARCDGWPVEMHRELESLLAAHDRAGSFFELPAQPLGAGCAESMVGRTAGPYTILAPLGAGGMGEVYLAHDSRLGRKVALKLLRPYFTKHPDRLRRFQREAIAASSLNHPSILTIYEVGHDDATDYIATEYIEGVTLRELMAREPLSIAGALDAALQVASALSAAHAAGIVHRDIKPENIMLRSDGYYKVLDFGLDPSRNRDRGRDPRSRCQTRGTTRRTQRTVSEIGMGEAPCPPLM